MSDSMIKDGKANVTFTEPELKEYLLFARSSKYLQNSFRVIVRKKFNLTMKESTNLLYGHYTAPTNYTKAVDWLFGDEE